MQLVRRLGAMLLVVAVPGAALTGEPAWCERPAGTFVQRVAPAGGWSPYGGGLVRWWPRHCFPCAGATDDYCRKQLPCVCWPPYPPYFTSGPSDCPTPCQPAACAAR